MYVALFLTLSVLVTSMGLSDAIQCYDCTYEVNTDTGAVTGSANCIAEPLNTAGITITANDKTYCTKNKGIVGMYICMD